MTTLDLRLSSFDWRVESASTSDGTKHELITCRSVLHLDRDVIAWRAPGSVEMPWSLDIDRYHPSDAEPHYAALQLRLTVEKDEGSTSLNESLGYALGKSSPRVLVELRKMHWREKIFPFPPGRSEQPLGVTPTSILEYDTWNLEPATRCYVPFRLSSEHGVLCNPDAVGGIEMYLDRAHFDDIRALLAHSSANEVVASFHLNARVHDNAFVLSAAHVPAITFFHSAHEARRLRTEYVRSSAQRSIRWWHHYAEEMGPGFSESVAAAAIGEIPNLLALSAEAAVMPDDSIEREVNNAISCVTAAQFKDGFWHSEKTETSQIPERTGSSPFPCLGLGPESPIVFERGRKHHSVPWGIDGVREAATQYRRCRWFWNPSVTRAYVHALLLLEAGRFISDLVYSGEISLAHVGIGGKVSPQSTKLASTLEGQQRSIVLRLKLLKSAYALLALVVWATGGAMLAGLRGAIVGVLARLQAVAWRPTLSLLPRNRSEELAHAMQDAVHEASSLYVNWQVLEEQMLSAARLGAVFEPVAFDLVADARRHTTSSRCYW